MTRPITVIGAPSNIGIRPYDDQRPRALDQAPAVLRGMGLVGRLHARDRGDIRPPAYHDFDRPTEGVRNEAELMVYLPRVADAIEGVLRHNGFPLVLGGDCSLVVASTLAARRATGGRIGLVYIDAHADFATPQESRTGSAASMCLAMTVGRGDSRLSNIDHGGPLVLGRDVVIVGRRDNEEQIYGEPFLEEYHILNLNAANLIMRGPDAIADTVLERVGRAELDGFWIHVDADVLDASVMKAVDSPEAGGPGVAEISALIRRLAREPGALGLELTIYDPGLDPDRSAGQLLVEMLERGLT